ncbi:MAG: peptidase M16, partial [Desulfobacterales bacterium]|nr:peptidase M16 [Desulfobacterales bacterium]
VFNEMKGAYSSPDNVLSDYSLQSLFPDNTYGLDSGGDPKEIPNLGFDQFKSFHEKYYHPSNARIFFYGDDDPDERLKIINEYLKGFDAIKINSAIRVQPFFSGPRRSVRTYMVGEESPEAKAMVTLNCLLSETTDVLTNFALRILTHILLGMPGSPLRKALIDSGLGEGLAGAGLEDEVRQMYFSSGLKGVDIKNAEQVEPLIMDTLSNLAQKGIDPHTVKAALNTVEFRLRENNTGRFPRGLSIMLRALTTWLYDGDPLALLTFEGPLEMIKESVESDSHIFEEMIDRFFITNPHRTTLILKPDPEQRQREEMDEKKRLANARSAMSPDELDNIIEGTMELKRRQETPDSPESLATIPMLRLEDMEKKNKSIPLDAFDKEGTPILFHGLSTNGIVYLDMGLNFHTLHDKFLPYMPLFGRALVEMGTEEEDFVTLTQRIGRKTGGIHPQLFTSSMKDTKRSAAWLFLRCKAMTARTESMINILRDVLLGLKLDNQERFRQMVLEEKAGQEQKLVSNGHQVVSLRLCSHFSEASWVAEQMSGVSYLFFLRELAEAVDNSWSEVLVVLQEILRILVNRNSMIFNVTLEEKNRAGFESNIYELFGALPEVPLVEADWARESQPALFEGMTIPSRINYVGKGADLYELGYEFHGSASVITRYLRNAWLWDRVRVRGGAYGAFCQFDRFSGILTFISYRDPNLVETLEAFDRTGHFLQDIELDNRELSKNIIGAIGDMDAYMLPNAKGFASMIRYLIGDTEEARQQIRDEVLGTRISDFKAFAQVLEQMKKSGLVKILGSPSAIEATETDRPGWLDVFKVL